MCDHRRPTVIDPEMNPPLRRPTAARALPRLIATDLDGTLMGADFAVSRRNASALRRAAAAGAAVVLVTGRLPRRMPPVYAQLAAHYPAICANGAVLYDPSADAVTACLPLKPAEVREVCRRLRLRVPRVLFAAEVDLGRRLAHEPGWPVRRHARHAAYQVRLDELTSTEAVKLLALAAELDSESFSELVTSTVGDLVEATYSSYGGLVEMARRGVTKATMLADLSMRLGISPADALVFGDMPNDIPMLRWAGRSVAVACAHPRARAAADEVTLSNVDDGVAVYLERLLDQLP